MTAKNTPSNSLTIQSNPQVDLVGDLESRWVASLQLRADSQEISPATKAVYQAGANHFLTWCDFNEVTLVTSDTIMEWQADLLSQGKKPGTVRTWLAGLRDLLGWAAGNRLITIDPSQGVNGPKRSGATQTHLRDMLTDEEMRRVIALPDTSTPRGKRDKSILTMFAYTAVRTGELQQADLADLRTLEGRLVLYILGKGKLIKDDFAVIPTPAEGPLHDWLAERGPGEGALYISLSNRSMKERLSLRGFRGLVKSYYRAAGITGTRKTTHSMRHSALSNAAKRMPLQKVQRLARHANPQTTMIYYHELDRLTNPAEDVINYED